MYPLSVLSSPCLFHGGALPGKFATLKYGGFGDKFSKLTTSVFVYERAR